MNQILEIQSSPQQALLYLLAFLKQQDYQFTTITPLSHQRILNRKKNEIYKHRTHQDIFGWNLNFKKTDLDSALFTLLQEHQLLQVQEDQYLSQVRVSSLDGELFIHSAFPTTQQDAVFFGPDTYRFIYHLKQYLAAQPRPFKRVVEMCCGTSAAAISLARHFPNINETLEFENIEKSDFKKYENRTFQGSFIELFSSLEKLALKNSLLISSNDKKEKILLLKGEGEKENILNFLKDIESLNEFTKIEALVLNKKVDSKKLSFETKIDLNNFYLKNLKKEKEKLENFEAKNLEKKEFKINAIIIDFVLINDKSLIQ